jgi:hypothetical protein
MKGSIANVTEYPFAFRVSTHGTRIVDVVFFSQELRNFRSMLCRFILEAHAWREAQA